jgi:uncharacterized protein (UPF0262 family)
MSKPLFEVGVVARDREGDAIEVKMSTAARGIFIGFRDEDGEEGGNVILSVDTVRSLISTLYLMCARIEEAAIEEAMKRP